MIFLLMSTAITQRKPYTVIVTRDDEVFLYDKTWIETMEYVMEHGFLVLPRYNETVHKGHIKRYIEVNSARHTSVENWIYTRPDPRNKKLLQEHKDRKVVNGVGITSIEQGQRILDRLQGKKKPKEPEQSTGKKVDKAKAMEILQRARDKSVKKVT